MKHDRITTAVIFAYLAVAHALAWPLTTTLHLLMPVPPEPVVQVLRAVRNGAGLVLLFFLPALIVVIVIDGVAKIVLKNPLLPAVGWFVMLGAFPAAVVLSIGLGRYLQSVASDDPPAAD